MPAESYVQLPQDSVGKKLRTNKQTVEGVLVEEQVVRLETHLKATNEAYAASAVGSVAAASRNHLVIWNTSGTNKWVEIIRVIVSNSSGNQELRLNRIFVAPTGGSAVTAAKLNTGNPDLPSALSILNGPTVGGTPVAIQAVTVVAGMPFELFTEYLTSQPLLLKEGEGVSVAQSATAGAGNVDVAIIFRLRAKEG